MSRDWTESQITNLLQNNNKFLARAIVALYKLQTQDEQRAKLTRYRNDVGFNAIDADFLSDLAQSAIDAHGRTGKYLLTTAQLNAARDRMMKYSAQLTDIANAVDDVTEISISQIERS